uniref:Uncharacterized protein n=1 Tax=Tanacetum cinerariifolium TaxID=118510 RepID=A0A6L2MN42_TANCI|nr:hypothetical protein [Tanacetum cinerariifolium]
MRMDLTIRIRRETLDTFCQKYHIPDAVHPELPGPNKIIHNSHVDMDLFASIRHADPIKVRIGEKQIKEGHIPLLDSTKGRVIPIAGEDDQAAATDKPEGKRKKRRATGGASGSNHPLKKLREDHDTSGNVSANTGRKSLVAIQVLLKRSTLNAEIGVMEAATKPFVASSMTPIEEHKAGGDNLSIVRPNLCTPHPSERFVISLDSSHHSSENAIDAEVASFVRSTILPPHVMTAVVTTTVIIGAYFTLVYKAGTGPAIHIYQSPFTDSISIGAVWPDVAASLESQRDGLTDQVSSLKTICSGLRDQVSGVLSSLPDHHSWSQWIIGYAAAFGAVISLAIDKARYVFAVLAFRDLYFDLLPQLESQKDASIADIMNSLHLEGPFAEILMAIWLQSIYEHLLLPIYQKEDNLKDGVVSHRLSISNAMGALVDPLSSENIIGKASTLGVPTTTATTTALSISITATNVSSISPISVAD